jgi:hypothetical protein
METRTVKVAGGKRYPVKSVMKVQRDEDGTVTRVVLSKKKKKRRVSKRWRKMDKALRKLNRAQQTSASEYLKRHERSNRKKKNGAIKDLGKNLSRSQRKGRKKLKIRIF